MAEDTPVSAVTPQGQASSQPTNGAKAPRGSPAPSRHSVAKSVKDALAIPRSAMPYLLASLIAAVTMGWYCFVFVPQKLEYFVGLRFRTLAVASGQIKGKAESLGQSLHSSPQADTGDYLRLLVPDIQLLEGTTARPSGLQLVSTRVGPPETTLQGAVAWDRVTSQAAAASVMEFDDLAVADAAGEVVWQREKTTPRLGNLKELLYAADDQGTLLSPSWTIRTVFPAADAKQELPETATLKTLRVGSTSVLMLVQAVHLTSPRIQDASQRRLYVAGFVSRTRLQQQAMRIPLAWLVAVALPVAVLFLALPFLKLGTMNAKERFSLANLILMGVGTIAAAGLAAVIPVGPRPVSEAGDETLKKIARLVDQRLGDETKSLIALASTINSTSGEALADCPVTAAEGWKKACDLWTPLGTFLTAHQTSAPELDVAIWLSDQGDQIRKWTTKVQVTGNAPHVRFEHFQRLKTGNLWYLDHASEVRFTIEPLRAPTTSELGVVFGMPLTALNGGTSIPVNGAHFLALNVRLRSVVDVVMPPGYGFALVAPDGRVLFHSTDGLSLEENFFEEVSKAQSVRERMRDVRAVTWSGDYHGVPHRIHVQAVERLTGCPWKIVTFQELTSGLAAVVQHQEGTFRLSLLNLVLLVIVALAAWWYTKHRGRDLRDVMTAPTTPDPTRLLALPVLALVAVAAIILAGRPWAHARVDALYLFFLVLPFAAVCVSIFARSSLGRRAKDADRPPRSIRGWLARCELAMLVLLVGMAPAAGFARLVQRVQDSRATERWLEAAHQRTVAHADRARLRAISPGYLRTTAAVLEKHQAFQGGAEKARPYFYLAGSPVYQAAGEAACSAAAETGQRFVRRLLDWTLFSADQNGDAGVRACEGSNLLQLRRGDVTLAASVWPVDEDADTSVLQGLSWERWLAFVAILAGTVGAAYWARYRLVTPSAARPSTISDVLPPVAATSSPVTVPESNLGIMLVGPPRMKKDRVVRNAVSAATRNLDGPSAPTPIYRIRLLDRRIDKGFVDATLGEVARRLADPAQLDQQGRLWIHVSNLEAQLTMAGRRTSVLGLLEQLMDRQDGEPVRVVIVTTSIDPVANFHEIFTKEREDIYDDDIPEVELSRCSLVLSRFHRCYLSINAGASVDPWWDYSPKMWRAILDWEAAHYPPLEEVAASIKKTFADRAAVPRADLARAFRSQALAAYDLLWESCTRSEKIVLVQLAQEGFIATRNCEVVWGLIKKGLIVKRPQPTIFNNTFRSFLRHIERDHVVEQWEREDGNGLWVVAGRLIGSSLIAGGLFFLVTQDFSFDSLLPVVSGTGVFGAPAVRALIARVTARGADLLG